MYSEDDWFTAAALTSLIRLGTPSLKQPEIAGTAPVRFPGADIGRPDGAISRTTSSTGSRGSRPIAATCRALPRDDDAAKHEAAAAFVPRGDGDTDRTVHQPPRPGATSPTQGHGTGRRTLARRYCPGRTTGGAMDQEVRPAQRQTRATPTAAADPGGTTRIKTLSPATRAAQTRAAQTRAAQTRAAQTRTPF